MDHKKTTDAQSSKATKKMVEEVRRAAASTYCHHLCFLFEGKIISVQPLAIKQ
jgi:hypothetical protein